MHCILSGIQHSSLRCVSVMENTLSVGPIIWQTLCDFLRLRLVQAFLRERAWWALFCGCIYNLYRIRSWPKSKVTSFEEPKLTVWMCIFFLGSCDKRFCTSSYPHICKFFWMIVVFADGCICFPFAQLLPRFYPRRWQHLHSMEYANIRPSKCHAHHNCLYTFSGLASPVSGSDKQIAYKLSHHNSINRWYYEDVFSVSSACAHTLSIHRWPVVLLYRNDAIMRNNSYLIDFPALQSSEDNLLPVLNVKLNVSVRDDPRSNEVSKPINSVWVILTRFMRFINWISSVLRLPPRMLRIHCSGIVTTRTLSPFWSESIIWHNVTACLTCSYA